MRQIYNDTESFTLSPGYRRALETFAPRSIAVNSGEYWRSHRKIVVGAFAPTQLRFAASVVMEKANVLINRWIQLSQNKETQNINVADELSKYTLDVIGRVAFDYNFDTMTKGSARYLKCI
jgi:cytochrome P450